MDDMVFRLTILSIKLKLWNRSKPNVRRFSAQMYRLRYSKINSLFAGTTRINKRNEIE